MKGIRNLVFMTNGTGLFPARTRLTMCGARSVELLGLWGIPRWSSTREGENAARELPTLNPLDFIAQICKEIRHRVSSNIPIEMVEFNHHFRAKPGDGFLGPHKNFVLSSFNIHLQDVRPNARLFTKGIHRSCMHSTVLNAPVEVDRAASGVRLFVRNCDGNFSGTREDSLIQCMNVPQVVQADIFL